MFNTSTLFFCIIEVHFIAPEIDNKKNQEWVLILILLKMSINFFFRSA